MAGQKKPYRSAQPMKRAGGKRFREINVLEEGNGGCVVVRSVGCIRRRDGSVWLREIKAHLARHFKGINRTGK